MTPPADKFTFEDLTEVYRREQRNKTISEVRRDLYPAMRECLEGLKRESEREYAVDQFSTRAKLASNQLMKFQEKSAQVFEFRFGKILDMALRAAQGNKVDTAKLTVEEQQIYDQVFSLLKERRAAILDGGRPRAVENEEPSLPPYTVPEMIAECRREEEHAETVAAQAAGPLPEAPPTPEAPTPVEVVAPPSVPVAVPDPPLLATALPDLVVLRVLEDIPAFAGPGRNYRLQKEDIVSLPPTIARALVARNKAVNVRMSP
ncbi:MAG: hypothetical protein ISF22_00385 [Methanomassiliicoccus sp.]|nr:hypothetical protein [Methanomassiliicoccus sp.]